MYTKAIQKLKDIQTDNVSFVDDIESGEFTINAPPDRIKSLCDAYRFWGHCAGMAAYLLENAREDECNHEWVSADNEVVTGAKICKICHEIREAEPPGIRRGGKGE